MRPGPEPTPPPQGDAAPGGPEPAPRWFWTLPLLVLAAWWPIAPFWASDDWFALHYAQDLANVWRDFAGPQYSAHDLFFFYRPLITLSHWLDVAIGGGDPFWSHLFNVLVHAANATLCACLWRRLLGDGRAFCAGLLFALAPGHIGGLGWAAGRTDGIAALTGMGTVLLVLRRLEGRQRTLLPALLVFTAGLMSKETVLCVPGLVALAAFALAPLGPGQRLRAAVRTTWPFALLLTAYFGWRKLVLGVLGGGYSSSSYDALVMLRGFGAYLLDLVDPWRWTNAPDVLPPAAAALPALPWLGLLPTAAAAVWWARRRERRRAVAIALGWFLCASVPLASFFADPGNHYNLRYFALAFAALAGWFAAGGALPTLLALAVFGVATAQMRIEQWRADDVSARMHRQLLQQLADGTPGPWFVAGLPHASPTGMALQYHFGVDRVLLPPFGPGGVQLYAHRPIFEAPGVVHLFDGEGLPLAPPAGTTFLFRGPDLLVTLPQRSLPALPIECDPIVDCTSPTLERIALGAVQPTLTTPGMRTPLLRLTFFTAGGYFGAVVPDMAPAAASASGIDLLGFFKAAQWATGRRLIDAVELATIVDLSTDFPVLVEAGRDRDGIFEPTHRTRSLVTFRFDRDLAALLRRLGG